MIRLNTMKIEHRNIRSMFGFGSTSKSSRQIADVIGKIIGAIFIGTKYITSNGSIKFPYNFFDDLYIRGFVYGLSGFMIQFEHPSIHKSHLKKGFVMMNVFEILTQGDGQRTMNEIQYSINTQIDDNFTLRLDHFTVFLWYICGHYEEGLYRSHLRRSKNYCATNS